MGFVSNKIIITMLYLFKQVAIVYILSMITADIVVLNLAYSYQVIITWKKKKFYFFSNIKLSVKIILSDRCHDEECPLPPLC